MEEFLLSEPCVCPRSLDNGSPLSHTCVLQLSSFHLEFSIFIARIVDHGPFVIIVIKTGTVSRESRRKKGRNVVIRNGINYTGASSVDAAINPFHAPTFRFKRSYENRVSRVLFHLPPRDGSLLRSLRQTFRSAH